MNKTRNKGKRKRNKRRYGRKIAISPDNIGSRGYNEKVKFNETEGTFYYPSDSLGTTSEKGNKK